VSAVLTVQEPSAKYLVNLQPPLVRHFDLIAQAPGGVTRLRELILTLAVQGKLVPQDPSDEPASELLKKIRIEKDRLIAEGKIKRDKPLAEIADEEKPFELPEGWHWMRLASVGDWAIGSGFPVESQGMQNLPVLFAKVSDMNLPGNEKFLYSANNSIDYVTVDKLRVNVHQAGTVVFPKIGGAIATNKRRILVKPTAIDNNCLGITPSAGIATNYLYLLLTSIDFTKYQAGTSVPALSQGTLGQIVIGLPPLAEQSRIVTRVEELMQLCDALEASGQLEAQQHAQLVNTLLGTLTQSETPEALADNWQRIATHFDVLLDRPEAVDALEQTILQLAVRGLLVPQDPNDEAASVLLQKIRTEKDHLIAQGQIKRDKPLPSIANDEVLFELPLSWEWTRLGNFCKVISGYAFSSEDLSCESGIRAIKITNAGVGEFYETDDYLPISFASGFENFKVEKDDLILALTRPYIASGLKISRCPPSYEGALINQRVAAIRPASAISFDFVFAYMCSKDVLNIYQNRFNGSGLQPNLKVSDVTELVMPLPPLSEQSRIVTRVNELRSLCIDLRQRLAAGQAVQSQLAFTLVSG
jgi:type I restriction enzyme S subunit